jgi:hypothetical protein
MMEYDARRYLIQKYGFGGRLNVPLTRDGFYHIFSDLGYKTGCEVGTYLGRNAASIILNNPTIKLYLVDAYDKKQWDVNTNYKFDVREAEKSAKKRMKKIRFKYGVKYEFIRKLSSKAVERFEDGSLDFVYIDANHSYEHVLEDIILWSKKVRTGGIIGGHDYDRYGMRHFEGVVKAVDKFTRKYRIKPVYITLDRPASFFWVKEKEYA